MSAPDLTPRDIAYAYCENEVTYGYPCRTEGCPHCGGPEEADTVAASYVAMQERIANRRSNRRSPLADKEPKP